MKEETRIHKESDEVKRQVPFREGGHSKFGAGTPVRGRL